MLALSRLLRSIMTLDNDKFYNFYTNGLVVVINLCCHQNSITILHKNTETYYTYIGKMSIANMRNRTKIYFHNSLFSLPITHKLSHAQLRVNRALIVISNTSILNPGPTNTVSVFYQNIQGLIPFSNLADNCPNLDVTKVAELQCSINLNKPDIIILNETWLKSSILDTEIFSTETYKVFRLDRSKATHPPPPTLRIPKSLGNTAGEF